MEETVPEDFVPEEVERNDHNFEEAEMGENKKKAANEKTGAREKKEASDKKAANKTLIEFLEGQILQLEEDLECPVCLDIASTTPIYKCPEDHLICRWAPSTKFIWDLKIKKITFQIRLCIVHRLLTNKGKFYPKAYYRDHHSIKLTMYCKD